MDFASILLILTVLLLAAVYIAQPFFQKGSGTNKKMNPKYNPELAKLDHARSSILAEKERVLSSIQELDFDNSLHKIPEDLYPVQRIELLQRAAGLLKQLEDMGVIQEPKTVPHGKGRSTGSNGYDEVEEMIARRRGEQKEKSTGFCPRCGKAIQATDHFCPKCGATIKSGL